MMYGERRSLAAALLVAAVSCAPLAHAAGELGNPSDPGLSPAAGGPTAGWTTQHWPMHGQRGDQRRRITESFTRTRYRSYSGTQVLPVTWWRYAYANAEVATGFSNGMGLVGPQGVWAVTSRFALRGVRSGFGCSQIFIGSGIYLGLGNGPWVDGNYLDGPNGCEQMPLSSLVTMDVPCGTYAGTPILIADPTIIQAETGTGTTPLGLLHVYAASYGCSPFGQYYGKTGRLVHKIGLTGYASIKTGATGPPIVTAYGTEIEDRDFPLSGNPHYSPTMENDIIYMATAREDADGDPYSRPNQESGLVYAINRGSLESAMTELWSAGLSLGSGSTGPLPKGQEPPPAAERYHPTTPVAVGQNLVVVGCVRYEDDYSLGYYREVQTEHALFGFNATTGALRFSYKVDAEILSTPAITTEFVIFGTKNGRAYAIEHSTAEPWRDGRVRWQTEWGERITYRTLPYSAPQQYADAALYGPAIDAAGDFAYFGGTDGRVHRFSTASGGVVSSPVLKFFREAESYSWGFNVPRDANGLARIHPCPISSAPVVYRNRTLLVKIHTNTQGGNGQNGSFLCVLQLPDMSMDSDISLSRNVRLAIGAAEFRGGGNAYGAVSLNGYSNAGLTGWDSINQVSFINDPGSGLKFGYGIQADSGGVSMGDGYAFATDSSGVILAIPSNEDYVPDAPTGLVEPHDPTAGPVPNPGPPVLGPVEAFPNPFMPSRARGGTFKFRNLPMGSRVELFTLAFERVKTLTESSYRAEWDATNEAGQPVATGVYLYKITFPGDQPPITGRVALTR